MRIGKKLVGVVGTLLLCATPAFADLATFTYSDLDGDFSSGSSTFTANNSSNTDGDVTRGGDSATFDFGSLGDIGSSSFNVTMAVSALTTTTASGSGTLTIVDVDGDKFTADLNGSWIKLGSAANFIGLLSNFMPDSSGGNGMFEGNLGTPFSMDFSPLTPPFAGNIISLTSQAWFTNGGGTAIDFSNKVTLTSGAVIPSPGAALLGLLGLGLVGRMKRKLA